LASLSAWEFHLFYVVALQPQLLALDSLVAMLAAAAAYVESQVPLQLRTTCLQPVDDTVDVGFHVVVVGCRVSHLLRPPAFMNKERYVDDA
jgi:hypothetical protein